MSPVLALHPQDLLAIAAVIVLWASLSMLNRRRRPPDREPPASR